MDQAHVGGAGATGTDRDDKSLIGGAAGACTWLNIRTDRRGSDHLLRRVYLLVSCSSAGDRRWIRRSRGRRRRTSEGTCVVLSRTG